MRRRRTGRGIAVRIEPEIGGTTLVLRGRFNPAIFVPAWFALHGLLPERVASEAELSIATPHLTAFGTDWLQLQVTDDHLSLGSTQAPFIRLRDLLLRIFREKLPETPVRLLGINRTVHFKLRSLSERDRIGRTLAPIEPWEGSGLKLGVGWSAGRDVIDRHVAGRSGGKARRRSNQCQGGAIDTDRGSSWRVRGS